ncbi:MAG TPA: VOC family protein [Phenylobacterium sp.]|jgi:catechol 2,3-dioxygenase-like lactoylglutathione lyase family enzyme
MFRTTVLAVALAISVGAPSAGAEAGKSPIVRVRYIVNDVQSSVAFYTGALGFKLDNQAGPYFAALTRGDVQLLLSPIKGPGGASQPMPDGQRPVPGGWNRIVLDTADLQGDVDRLRKAGVHFRSEIINGLGGRQIVLDDPSGNSVELFQPG